MAIRKFRCGHTRTIQPYKQTVVHQIDGDCPNCGSRRLVNIGDRRPARSEKAGSKMLVLRKR